MGMPRKSSDPPKNSWNTRRDPAKSTFHPALCSIHSPIGSRIGASQLPFCQRQVCLFRNSTILDSTDVGVCILASNQMRTQPLNCKYFDSTEHGSRPSFPAPAQPHQHNRTSTTAYVGVRLDPKRGCWTNASPLWIRFSDKPWRIAIVDGNFVSRRNVFSGNDDILPVFVHKCSIG